MRNSPFNAVNNLLVGKAPKHLLVCKDCECKKSVCIVDPIVPQMPWLCTLKCTLDNCHATWSVCRICSNTRIQYVDDYQIKVHDRKYHKNKTSNIDNNILATINEDFENESISNELVSFSCTKKHKADDVKSNVIMNFSNDVCSNFVFISFVMIVVMHI